MSDELKKLLMSSMLNNRKETILLEQELMIDNMQLRIDKAIEYIENGRLYDVNDNCINEILLDILKGEVNNE